MASSTKKIKIKMKVEKIENLLIALLKCFKEYYDKIPKYEKKLCMFHQHVLIMYAFLAPTTSHVSLVIKHIPYSHVINGMISVLKKPKCQAQHSLLAIINLHTCKHFVFNSNLSFLACNLFTI